MVPVRVIILVFGQIAQPPHTDENDGDNAEDNGADVLLACWYSECDC